MFNVLDVHISVPVSVKLFAVIAVTASVSVNAKVAPEPVSGFEVAFRNALASFVQVSTGAVVSGIVTVVLTEVEDILPAIPL